MSDASRPETPRTRAETKDERTRESSTRIPKATIKGMPPLERGPAQSDEE